jgi:hypothetical protein
MILWRCYFSDFEFLPTLLYIKIPSINATKLAAIIAIDARGGKEIFHSKKKSTNPVIIPPSIGMITIGSCRAGMPKPREAPIRAENCLRRATVKRIASQLTSKLQECVYNPLKFGSNRGKLRGGNGDFIGTSSAELPNEFQYRIYSGIC